MVNPTVPVVEPKDDSAAALLPAYKVKEAATVVRIGRRKKVATRRSKLHDLFLNIHKNYIFYLSP